MKPPVLASRRKDIQGMGSTPDIGLTADKIECRDCARSGGSEAALHGRKDRGSTAPNGGLVMAKTAEWCISAYLRRQPGRAQ
jgi:hypothetical protein